MRHHKKIIPSINHRKTKETCEQAYNILKKFRVNNAVLKLRFEKEYGIHDWEYPNLIFGNDSLSINGDINRNVLHLFS